MAALREDPYLELWEQELLPWMPFKAAFSENDKEKCQCPCWGGEGLGLAPIGRIRILFIESCSWKERLVVLAAPILMDNQLLGIGKERPGDTIGLGKL